MKSLRLPLSLLLAAGLGVLIAGCATVRPVRTIALDAPLIIHIADADTISAVRESITGERLRVRGFCRPKTREIWVEYGEGVEPDAETLLHELRHLPEWDGAWHVTGYSGRQIEAVDQSTAVIE